MSFRLHRTTCQLQPSTQTTCPAKAKCRSTTLPFAEVPEAKRRTAPSNSCGGKKSEGAGEREREQVSKRRRAFMESAVTLPLSLQPLRPPHLRLMLRTPITRGIAKNDGNNETKQPPPRIGRKAKQEEWGGAAGKVCEVSLPEPSVPPPPISEWPLGALCPPPQPGSSQATPKPCQFLTQLGVKNSQARRGGG